jgi:hypothetical protein
MSRRLDPLAPFSARLRSLVHVVTSTCNRSLFFAPKLREPLKEGMVDTQISALGGWPTVSGRFVRQGDRAKKPLGEGTPAYGCRQSTLVQHERSVWME